MCAARWISANLRGGLSQHHKINILIKFEPFAVLYCGPWSAPSASTDSMVNRCWWLAGFTAFARDLCACLLTIALPSSMYLSHEKVVNVLSVTWEQDLGSVLKSELSTKLVFFCMIRTQEGSQASASAQLPSMLSCGTFQLHIHTRETGQNR